jgi:NAD(P)-dependent dehydrogenase (short-subunit alcohol dehydrogenase family)
MLGRAIVSELHAGGARVVAVDRATDGDMDGGDGIRHETADVTDATSVDDLFKRVIHEHGRVDIVVHAVGAFRAGGIVDSTEDDWQVMLDLNLTGAWWMSRAAARVMQQAGGGSIVHIGARNSVDVLPGAAAYGVTKAALAHLTRVLDSELRGSGVRVNAVLPGVIDTPANRAALSAGTMRRAVSPQAIAKVIVFLASEAAAPVSGAVIPVYGTG